MRGALILVLAALGVVQMTHPGELYAQDFLENKWQASGPNAQAFRINPLRQQSLINSEKNSRGRDSIEGNRPAITSFSPYLSEECTSAENCPQWGSPPSKTAALLPSGRFETGREFSNVKQFTTEFAMSARDQQLTRYFNVANMTDPSVIRAMTDAERYINEQISEALSSRQKTIQELKDHPSGAKLLNELLGCEKKRMTEKKMVRHLAWLSCIGDSRDQPQGTNVTITGKPEEIAKPSDDINAVAPTGGTPSQDNKASLWDMIFAREIDAQGCNNVQGDQKQLCQQIVETNRLQRDSNKLIFGDLVYTQQPDPQNPNLLETWVERYDPWYDPNQYLPDMKLKKKILGIELEYLLNALDSAQSLMWLMHEACVSFNKNAPDAKEHDPFDENNFGNAGNLLQSILGAIGININIGGGSGSSNFGAQMPLGQEGLLCGGLDANDSSVKKAFAKLSTSRFTYSCEHAKVHFFEFFKHQVRTRLYKSTGNERLKCDLIEPTAQKVVEMYRKSLDPKEAKDVLRYIRKSWFKHTDEVAMFRIFEMLDLAEEKLSLLSTCQQPTSMCQDAFRLIQQKRGKITPEVIQEGLRDAYADKVEQRESQSAERSGGVSQLKPGQSSSSSSSGL